MYSKAPISETLAAALIMLTPWKKGPDSGELVLRKRNISDGSCDDGFGNFAPGIKRDLRAEQWTNLIQPESVLVWMR